LLSSGGGSLDLHGSELVARLAEGGGVALHLASQRLAGLLDAKKLTLSRSCLLGGG
jgi:hypothetical protein